MEISIIIDGEFEGCPEPDWFQRITEQVLIAQGISPDAELGIMITGQEKIQELNRTYRGEDRPTDVLAFYMTTAGEELKDDSDRFVVPPDGMLHLGEVMVSYPQAVLQAKEQKHSVKKELAILIIHGVLHLLGYDHEKLEQRREMAARERDILNKIALGLEGINDEKGGAETR